MVSARKERPNFIIWADFLATHNCDMSLRHKIFTVGGGGGSIECMLQQSRVTHARLKLA